MRRAFVFNLFLLAGLLIFSRAEAAILYLAPETRGLKINQEFTVDLKVNTENASINAAQATINFPNSVLSLLSVDKSNSIFNFWVEEPAISNENGALKLIGGTQNGVSGGALQILRLKFRAAGAGSANLTISDAVVTADDGKGTNVLSAVEGTSVAVGIAVVAPPPPPPPPVGVAPPVVQPIRVARPPVIAKVLPAKPQLKVPLYPDQNRWHSQVGELIVLWDVPEDVTNIATALDKNPRTEPKNVENDLFNGKNFGKLEDGIWYAQVQFKNSLGWGPVADYKISIDTAPPLPFEIEIDPRVGDDPAPVIKFETNDNLSGIAEARIFLDNKDLTRTSETAFRLPRQIPGKHHLTIQIFDNAGNSIKGEADFETIPLALPVIDFVPKTLSQEEELFVTGKILPNFIADLVINSADGREVFKGEVNPDAAGSWKASVSKQFSAGNYILKVIARDERGAVSYPAEARFKVRPKIVVSLGPLDFGWFEILLVVILLVISASAGWFWYYASIKRTRAAYNIIAARDTDKMAELLETDLKELERSYKKDETISSDTKSQMDFRMEKLRGTVSNMKKYLIKELEKLG